MTHAWPRGARAARGESPLPREKIRMTSKILALFALSVLVLSSFALGGTSAAPSSKPAQIPRPAAAPEAPQPRNLTFYMHNATIGKDINGVTTPYIFDTWQAFGRNNTVTKVQTVQQDWYLFPVLAGNLTLNGTMTMHLFVSIDQVGSQMTPTLTVTEVNRSGSATLVYTNTYGSAAGWTTPHDLVLATPPLQHTFAAGSTILVVVKITSGVRTTTIWYNASWVPTHLVLQSDDFASVAGISFLDSSGTPRTSFDPLVANKDIDIVANVTDPLGGYDIRWVNVTLWRPGGSYVFRSQPLTRVSGTPVSFLSSYDLVWNYSGEPVGRYNVTIGVLDNSGSYHFSQFFTTDGFLAQLDAFFYVGGLPTYVNVEAMDSQSAALAGAMVGLVSSGVTVDAKATDALGIANLTMAKGTYEFDVLWQGVKVASVVRDVQSNVSATSPFIIVAQVYTPTILAQDADGVALGDASLVFVHPNGEKIGPLKTNASGEATLRQVPVGTYVLTASWRGVDVFSGNEAVSSDAVIPVPMAVYRLTVTATTGDGRVLPGVFVSTTDAAGLVFDAGITSSDGTVVLRLPAGDYTVNARYISSYLGTSYDSGVRSTQVGLTASTRTTVTFADFPIPLTSTLEFQFALAYAATVAGLAAVFLFLWRRKKASRVEPGEPERKA